MHHLLTTLRSPDLPAPACSVLSGSQSILCLVESSGGRPRECHSRRCQPTTAGRQRPVVRTEAASPPPAPPLLAASVTGKQQQQQQQQQQQPTHLEQQWEQPPPQQCSMHFLVKNEQGAPCLQASGPWLEAAPRGAYTTARTVGCDAVLELSFHIQRLANSAALMTEAAAAAAAADPPAVPLAVVVAAAAAANPAQLRPRVLAAMRAAVVGYRAAAGNAVGELRLTVLVTWPGCQDQPDGQHEEPVAASSSNSNSNSSNSSSGSSGNDSTQPDVYVHVSALPPRPPPPVRVVMRGGPRHNAEAKDSEWVRQRKALQQGLPHPIEEVVLVGEGGTLYEGLSSNFFAVCSGTVHTAGEGILAGTVREVVLAVAQREGIPVMLQPPLLADLEDWEGCFISSTSRLLLPVDEAGVFPDEGGSDTGNPGNRSKIGQPVQLQRVRHFKRGGLVQRLEELVLAELAARSEPLFL